jgi:hypothetical protein
MSTQKEGIFINQNSSHSKIEKFLIKQNVEYGN